MLPFGPNFLGSYLRMHLDILLFYSLLYTSAPLDSFMPLILTSLHLLIKGEMSEHETSGTRKPTEADPISRYG